MSDTKFTPAPWHTSKPKGEHRSFVMADSLRVATVAFNRGKCNVKANAKLIAAAPEMYAQLAELRDSMAFLKGDDYELVVQADKVLAKARGE